MAGSASKSNSTPVKPGIAACSIGWRTVSDLSRPRAEALADWLQSVLKIRTSNEEFYRLYRQALEDMAALRLPIAGTDHMVFLPAAGMPWFVAPFGRDSLIVSLQNMLIYPDFARGTPKRSSSSSSH